MTRLVIWKHPHVLLVERPETVTNFETGDGYLCNLLLEIRIYCICCAGGTFTYQDTHNKRYHTILASRTSGSKANFLRYDQSPSFMQITRVAESCRLGNQAEFVLESDTSLNQPYSLWIRTFLDWLLNIIGRLRLSYASNSSNLSTNRTSKITCSRDPS